MAKSGGGEMAVGVGKVWFVRFDAALGNAAGMGSRSIGVAAPPMGQIVSTGT